MPQAERDRLVALKKKGPAPLHAEESRPDSKTRQTPRGLGKVAPYQKEWRAPSCTTRPPMVVDDMVPTPDAPMLLFGFEKAG